ncbi:MAG: DUF2062 domain-containing protein [Proteobacteria bacterium]|nr:DUF2062 domain-containing protein [Pseudomonadota bacterium]
MRFLIKQLMVLEHKYLRHIRKHKLLAKIVHEHLFSIKEQALARGLAIGLFWTCIPMPFQMFPAALFCWLGFANLPVAIVAVWISNPFTYLPIFYVEYSIGAFLFHRGEEKILSFEEFNSRYAEIAQSLGKVYLIVLEGALVMGVALAIIGYLVGPALSRYLLSIHPRYANFTDSRARARARAQLRNSRKK